MKDEIRKELEVPFDLTGSSKTRARVTQRCMSASLEFREKLLRSFAPEEMNGDQEIVEFLKQNGVTFVLLPSGQEEIHGFGRRLGTVTTDFKEEEKGGVKFVQTFTPIEINEEEQEFSK